MIKKILSKNDSKKSQLVGRKNQPEKKYSVFFSKVGRKTCSNRCTRSGTSQLRTNRLAAFSMIKLLTKCLLKFDEQFKYSNYNKKNHFNGPLWMESN